jgi:hypothetical protein
MNEMFYQLHSRATVFLARKAEIDIACRMSCTEVAWDTKIYPILGHIFNVCCQ